ncbi:MAG: hypothetical protein ACT4OH_01445 [Methylophilaceae bacterium]
MVKLIFKSLLLFIGSFATVIAGSVEQSGVIAVHIAKRHYEHPVRLLSPYSDFWHMKGPLAEKVVLKTLQQRFTNTAMCASSSHANMVLLIEPHLFYNPQLWVFHAEIIARVYTHSSQPITTIKQQAQQNGSLNIKPEFYLEKAYTKAMEKMIKKLEDDPAFIDALKQNSTQHAETLCNTLDELPLAKFYY